MDQIWWYLTRASGVVATFLFAAALIGGFFFSARSTGRRRAPRWWLDLHNMLGGLALVFTLIHVGAVFNDDASGLGLTEILVPLTASASTWGIAWGVVGTYLLAAVVLSSWPTRRGSRRLWLATHLLSMPAALMAGVHAWMVGASRDGWWFRALLAGLAGAVAYPAVLRLFSAVHRSVTRRRRRRRSAEVDPMPSAEQRTDRVELVAPGGRR